MFHLHSVVFVKGMGDELQACGSVVVKAVYYKLEGHRFGFFKFTYPSDHSRPWGFLSPEQK
jgi:hypothetical protein